MERARAPADQSEAAQDFRLLGRDNEDLNEGPLARPFLFPQTGKLPVRRIDGSGLVRASATSTKIHTAV